MKRLGLILFHTVSLTGMAPAKRVITPIDSISDVQCYLDNPDKTLVLMDIDDTLIKDTEQVPFDFFSWTLKHTARKPAFIGFGWTEPLECEENVTSFTLGFLREAGYKVLGLTNRLYGLMDITLEQLNKFNMAFDDISAELPPLTSSVSRFITRTVPGKVFGYNLSDIPGVEKGVICTSGLNKGKVLVKAMEILELSDVRRIVFVDDKFKNLRDVNKELEFRYPEIEFVGLHYISDGC